MSCARAARTFPGMNDPSDKQPENEGEGSRSADRQYRRGVEATVQKGRVEEDAERARREVSEDPEPYRRAEEEGRSHSAGEAPGDLDR